MSRTRIVKGSYTKISHEGHSMYSNENIITSAGKEITETGVNKGVGYGDPKTPPTIKEEAKCIVHFRPKENWRGEFAFDWFREGNSTLLDDVDFNEIVGKYYKYDEKEIQKRIEKNNVALLKDIYITDQNKWYTVEKDSDNNITGAKEFFKKDPQYLATDNCLDKLKQMYQAFSYNPKDGGKEKTYYASIIGLFPENEKYGPYEAILNMHIEFLTDEKPEYLIFKVDGMEITDQHPIIGLSRYKIENPSELEAITIKCKARSGKNGVIELFYNTTKAIQVYSVKNKTENLAGVIKFINTTAVQKKKIVIIKVQTAEGCIGRPTDNYLVKFEKYLNQCLLKPEIISTRDNGNEITLILNYEDFITKCKANMNQATKEWKIFSTGYLDGMLAEAMEDQYSEYMNDEYFRLYFLDVNSISDSVTEKGYSKSNQMYGVMFKSHDTETIGHECMHGLGLSHTFYFKAQFTFKAQKTQNIMDYSGMKNNPMEVYNNKPNAYIPKEEYYLWYWQWKNVNRNIQ